MKITTSIVLFYVWLTAAANLLVEIGFAEALGIPLQTSAGESFGDAVAALGDIQAGGLSGESLLGVFTVISNSVEGFLVALTMGPRFMINLGIPSVFVVFLHAPIGLLGARLLIYSLSGREL